MGAALRYQPQGLARVAQSGLSRGLVFATTDPLAPLSASGHVQTQQGSGFIRSFTRDGRTVAAGTDQSTTGVIVLPAAVRDALVGKPITVAWVCDGARASAQAQAVYCHRDGSTQALYIGSSTTNVQFTVSGFSDVFISMPYVAAATRFVLTADGTTVTLYTDVGIRSAPGAGLPAATTILPSILNRQTGGRGNSSNVANISVWNRALTPAEAAQWQANPWQLFDAGSSSSAYQAAIASTAPAAGDTGTPTSTPANIAPAGGSLALTGYAPSVVQASNIAILPGSLAVAGYAPTVSQSSGIAISPGALALTGFAPTVSQASGIAIGAGSLALTGYAPSVTQASNLALQAGSLGLTGYAPVVSQFNGQSLSLQAGALSITGFAPGITQTNGVALQAGPLALTGYAPVVSQTAPAARYARPLADVAAGAWAPSSGGSLAAMLSEAAPDAGTYIQASTPSVCEVHLNAVVDPGTSSGQVVRYQAGSASGNGLIVRFKQGATVIAQWTHASLPAAQTLFTQTLTSAQCDSITDYGDLRFEFEAT